MGHWDRKNYIISVKLRESCSDKRIINWQISKDYTYSIEEVTAYEKTISPIYNSLSEQIIKFFVDYNWGILLPDKWNKHEPIKNRFDLSEINNYISILSYPDGVLYLKKDRKFTCEISNNDYGFWWFGGKPCRPKIVFDYLVEIKFLFSKQSKPKMDFLQQLTNDLAAYFGTDYAKIIDQEIASALPPLYERDPAAVIYDINGK